MMQQTPWWKGIKFWITFLLAAYAAATATWLLLRDQSGQQEPGGTPVGAVAPVAEERPGPTAAPPPEAAREQEPPPVPPETAPDAEPKATVPAGPWRERIAAAQDGLRAVLTAQQVADGDGIVTWATTSLLPDLSKLVKPDVTLDRQQAACLAELEWELQALAKRLQDPNRGDDIATLDDLDRRLEQDPIETVTDAAYWVARVRARGADAPDLLDRVYRAWLRVAGKDDVYVRKGMGYTEFQYDIHPDLAFRRHPFIREVERAAAKRWFSADETVEWARARVAAERTDVHFKRLLVDARFRASEELKANLYESTFLRGLHMITHWADPYLVCYVSNLDLGPDTRIGFEPETSSGKATREHRAFARARMQARGKLYQAVHAEFYRRWGQRLRLRPLMDPYGGRPDYPVRIRSYANGRPFVALLFDERMDRDTLMGLIRVGASPFASIPEDAAFVPQRYRQGGIMAQERGGVRSDQVREATWVSHARAAADQLWYWSIRQRNNWGRPFRGLDLGSAALSMRLGALQNDGTQIGFGRWTGIQLAAFQKTMAELRASGRPKTGWVPLAQLASMTSAAQFHNWVAKNWQLARQPMLYHVHAAAFADLCLNSGDRALKKSYVTWLDLIAHGEGGTKALASFREAFRISGDDDWEDLQELFDKTVDSMLAEDPAKWRFVPPAD